MILNCASQDRSIIIRYSDSSEIPDSTISIKSQKTNTQILESVISDLINQNYLSASLDSFYVDSLSAQFIAEVYKGEKYSLKDIKLDSIKGISSKKIDLENVRTIEDYKYLRNAILFDYGESGYPFAKLRLKDASIESGIVNGWLSLEKGQRIIIDSLRINGSLRLRKPYLEKYLDIEQGQFYQHSKVRNMQEQLSKISFAEQQAPPEITFFGNYGTIDLFLDQKNTSRFDLIFGVIPTTNIEGQQLFLSLDFTAELLNRMGDGEYIFVDFERLRPEQQKFEFNFNYPYLLNLPYAIDIDFSIFRLSLDYQTLLSDIGLQYLIDNNEFVKVGWNYEESNLVEVDTTQLLNSGMLPQDLDVTQNGLSVEYFKNNLDYTFNPRRGYLLKLKAVAGRKTIQRNASILTLKSDNIDFSTSYDSLQLNSSRLDLRSDVSFFFPLANRAALGIRNQSGWRYSNSTLYRNEKYQLGGNKLLRGFDEASIFTEYYVITTLDYRLLLSNNSYFSFPFIDFGFIEDLDGSNTYALGLGGSLGIETGAGLFNFSIAVGRTKNVGFDFGRPKAHFGFVSLF